MTWIKQTWVNSTNCMMHCIYTSVVMITAGGCIIQRRFCCWNSTTFPSLLESQTCFFLSFLHLLPPSFLFRLVFVFLFFLDKCQCVAEQQLHCKNCNFIHDGHLLFVIRQNQEWMPILTPFIALVQIKSIIFHQISLFVVFWCLYHTISLLFTHSHTDSSRATV